MSRTLMAVMIFVISCIVLGLSWRGIGLRRDLEATRAEVVRKEAKVQQRDRDIILQYQLRKVSMRKAEAEMAGKDPQEIQRLAEEIAALEAELRALEEHAN